MSARPAGADELIEFLDIPEPDDPALGGPATPLPDAAAAAPATFEFELDPADLPRLLRAPALAARREGRVRTSVLRTVWHDTATAELAAAGLSLGEQPGCWQLARLRPNGAGDWLPASPAPVLEEAASLHALGRAVPQPLVPVAAFAGRQRIASLAGPATLTILEGSLRGVASDRPRLPASAVRTRARHGHAGGRIGGACAARRAACRSCGGSHSGGQRPAARRQTPGRAAGASGGHGGGSARPRGVAPGGCDPALVTPGGGGRDARAGAPDARRRAPFPLGRVGVPSRRRPALDQVALQLRALAAALGAARDWDVFIEGTGAAVGHAFAGDQRVAGMLAAAERRRREAYAALAATLQGREFQRLAMTLALLPSLRPWNETASSLLGEPARGYAARMLDRRLKHVTAPGGSLGRHAGRRAAWRAQAGQAAALCGRVLRRPVRGKTGAPVSRAAGAVAGGAGAA